MADKAVLEIVVDSSGAITSIKHLGQQLELTERKGKSLVKTSNVLGGALAGLAGGALALGLAVKSLDVGISIIRSAMENLAKEPIKVAGRFEVMELRLASMLKSADAARAKLAELSRFAADTPFQMSDLLDATTKLMSFGGAALASAKNLQLLGDTAAEKGKNIADLAEWFGRAYGLIREGKGLGEVQMRLTEMGVAIPGFTSKLEKMRKEFTASNLIWEEFTKQFERSGGAMKALSQTLEGRISTLGDEWELFQAKIGQAGPAKALNVIIEGLTNLIKSLSDNSETAAIIGRIVTSTMTAAVNIGMELLQVTNKIGASFKNWRLDRAKEDLKKLEDVVAWEDFDSKLEKLKGKLQKAISAGDDKSIISYSMQIKKVSGQLDEYRKKISDLKADIDDHRQGVKDLISVDQQLEKAQQDIQEKMHALFDEIKKGSDAKSEAEKVTKALAKAEEDSLKQKAVLDAELSQGQKDKLETLGKELKARQALVSVLDHGDNYQRIFLETIQHSGVATGEFAEKALELAAALDKADQKVDLAKLTRRLEITKASAAESASGANVQETVNQLLEKGISLGSDYAKEIIAVAKAMDSQDTDEYIKQLTEELDIKKSLTETDAKNSEALEIHKYLLENVSHLTEEQVKKLQELAKAYEAASDSSPVDKLREELRVRKGMLPVQNEGTEFQRVYEQLLRDGIDVASDYAQTLLKLAAALDNVSKPDNVKTLKDELALQQQLSTVKDRGTRYQQVFQQLLLEGVDLSSDYAREMLALAAAIDDVGKSSKTASNEMREAFSDVAFNFGSDLFVNGSKAIDNLAEQMKRSLGDAVSAAFADAAFGTSTQLGGMGSVFQQGLGALGGGSAAAGAGALLFIGGALYAIDELSDDGLFGSGYSTTHNEGFFGLNNGDLSGQFHHRSEREKSMFRGTQVRQIWEDLDMTDAQAVLAQSAADIVDSASRLGYESAQAFVDNFDLDFGISNLSNDPEERARQIRKALETVADVMARNLAPGLDVVVQGGENAAQVFYDLAQAQSALAGIGVDFGALITADFLAAAEQAIRDERIADAIAAQSAGIVVEHQDQIANGQGRGASSNSLDVNVDGNAVDMVDAADHLQEDVEAIQNATIEYAEAMEAARLLFLDQLNEAVGGPEELARLAGVYAETFMTVEEATTQALQSAIESAQGQAGELLGQLGTSRNSFFADYNAALDSGMSPEDLATWLQAADALSQLMELERQMASARGEALQVGSLTAEQLEQVQFGMESFQDGLSEIGLAFRGFTEQAFLDMQAALGGDAFNSLSAFFSEFRTESQNFDVQMASAIATFADFGLTVEDVTRDNIMRMAQEAMTAGSWDELSAILDELGPAAAFYIDQLEREAEARAGQEAFLYSNFGTEDQQFERQMEQARQAFSDLGLDINDFTSMTRADFLAMFEALDESDPLRDKFLQLAPVLHEILGPLDQVEAAFSSLSGAIDSAVSGINAAIGRILATGTGAGPGPNIQARIDQIQSLLSAGGLSTQSEIDLITELTSLIESRYNLEMQSVLDIDQQLATMQNLAAERANQLAQQAYQHKMEVYQEELAHWQRLQQIAQTLRDYLHSLTFSGLAGLSVQEQFAVAQQDYLTALATYNETGEGGENLSQLANQYLGLAQQVYASSPQYQEIFGQVTSQLQSIVSSIDAEGEPVEPMEPILREISQNTAVSASAQAEIAALQQAAVDELEQYRAHLRQLEEEERQRVEAERQAGVDHRNAESDTWGETKRFQDVVINHASLDTFWLESISTGMGKSLVETRNIALGVSGLPGHLESGFGLVSNAVYSSANMMSDSFADSVTNMTTTFTSGIETIVGAVLQAIDANKSTTERGETGAQRIARARR